MFDRLWKKRNNSSSTNVNVPSPHTRVPPSPNIEIERPPNLKDSQTTGGLSEAAVQPSTALPSSSLPDREIPDTSGSEDDRMPNDEHARTTRGVPEAPTQPSEALPPPHPDPEYQHPTGDSVFDRFVEVDRAPQATGESPRIVNIEDVEPDDIVIAVFGPTGSGKSTFIRSASGRTTHAVGHTLKSCTSEVIAIRFWDEESRQHVVLVDTPGFDNTSKTESEILGMISEWLNLSYKKNMLLSGILYFHRITDNCMAATPLKNLRVFQKLCGKDALGKVYLTTTMWDEVDKDVGERRLDELSREYWKPMLKHGAQIARCGGGYDQPKKIIRNVLLQKGNPKSLLVQQEMVELKRGFEETSAGQQQPNKEPQEPPQRPPPVAREPSAIVDIEDLEPNDIVIAVLGPTGSGKSSFISSASGRDTQEVGHTLRSFTSQVRAVKYWDQESKRHVVLVDTPGFDHTYKSDSNILTMISGWLKSSYDQNKVLSGILYFHRITDNRMAATPLKNLRAFRQLCGKEVLDKVYLTTTMWDEVDRDLGERRLEELIAEYWKPMTNRGAHVARCRGDADPPKELVRRIIFQELERKAQRLRQEMIETEKELNGVVAGQQLYSELEKLVEKQSNLLRRIAKERKEASNLTVLTELYAEYTDLLEQIDDRLRHMQELRSSWKNPRRFLPWK